MPVLGTYHQKVKKKNHINHIPTQNFKFKFKFQIEIFAPTGDPLQRGFVCHKIESKEKDKRVFRTGLTG